MLPFTSSNLAKVSPFLSPIFVEKHSRDGISLSASQINTKKMRKAAARNNEYFSIFFECFLIPSKSDHGDFFLVTAH